MVLPDMQVPFEDTRSLAAVEKYMATLKLDGLLYIGDFIDFDIISSFNKHSPRKTEGRRIWKDMERANAILDRHQRIVKANNRKAKFVLLEGNHEERV